MFLLYLTRFWVELAVELCPLLFVVVFGLGGRLLGALEGRPPTVDEELTNFEEETLGLCAMPTPLLMLEAPPMTLIGPLRKELSMFFELVAFVPSICFDKLIEEFKPPAVEWVLAWLRSTRL